VNARVSSSVREPSPAAISTPPRPTLVQAQAAYDIAKQHLESLENVSNKAALENAQGNLDSAKGKYLGAQAELSYTEIRSPVSGVVTDRPLFAGRDRGRWSAADHGDGHLRADRQGAHRADAGPAALRLALPATLTVPGIADPVPAKVSLISPALDPGSTTVEVWLRVENPKGTLKAGTPVHASITGRTIANALTVPAGSDPGQPDGTSKFVMVIAPDSTAHKKAVTLGFRTRTTRRF
jgi:HlyD family secretion protein